MAGRELSLFHQLGYGRRKPQQPQRIGDGRPGFPDASRRFLLRKAVVRDQFLVSPRLFHWIQVFTLQIFNQSDLISRAVIGLQDTDGNLGETGHARSAPAPFAGDDLIVPGGKPAHEDRLDQSVLRDRCGKILQTLLVKPPARLFGARFDRRKRQQLFG